MLQYPSIPVQFAKPIPTVTTKAPSDILNRPGPYGAQPQSAPRVGPSTSMPPSGAFPGAGAAAAGAGGGFVIPAVILSIPMAVAGGETGNPIMNTQREMEAIRRADRARGQERDSTDRPGKGNRNQSDPTNPNGAARRPNTNTRPRPPITSAPQYEITFTTQRTGSSPINNPPSTVTRSGPIGGVEVRVAPGYDGVYAIGIQTGEGFFTILQVGELDLPLWRVNITGIRRTDLPPPPVNPGPFDFPNGTSFPIGTSFPNPSQRRLPPNPTQPAQPSQPNQPNPTDPNPNNPNPTNPANPSNPNNPNQPINPNNPNPTQPAQPSNPSNPTDPNPINPNPTQPANPNQPSNPTNPTDPNPVNPRPRSPGPMVPVSPGPMVPVSPGPLVPKSPIPNGPNNPKRDPCGDPCIDTALSRTEPVVIQVKQFVSCTRAVFGIPAPYNTIPVTVPRLFAPAFQLVLDNQAELLKQISCNPPEPSIAAIPDWWQIRLGANRPQLLVLYARKFNDGTWDKPKYVLSVPHWKKSKLETVFGDFPAYDKGDFQGTRVLPDNSKLIVNAVSSDEARRVITKLSAGIPSSMIEFAQTSIADRRGAPLRKITVYPRIVRYFASGQKDLAPTWSIDFR